MAVLSDWNIQNEPYKSMENESSTVFLYLLIYKFTEQLQKLIKAVYIIYVVYF